MMSEQLFIREFELDLALREAEGVVEGLVVPFNRETQVADITEHGVVRYTEVIRPGAFERAIAAPNRVSLTFNHDESLPAVLGSGVAFREVPEGLWGTFRLHSSRAGIAKDVLTTSHRAFSIGFRSINPRHGAVERDGALVERRAVHLRHVAAVPQGAYEEALVAAVREAAEETDEQKAAEAQAAANEALLRDLDALLSRGEEFRRRFA